MSHIRGQFITFDLAHQRGQFITAGLGDQKSYLWLIHYQVVFGLADQKNYIRSQYITFG